MNICFCVSAMESGGAEKVVSVLANYLSKCGNKVTILMVSTAKKSSFYYLSSDVVLMPLLLSSTKKQRGIISRTIALKKALKSLNPDVIISFLSHINIYTYFASRGLKIPLIVSERNCPSKEPKTVFLRNVRNFVFRHADGCVFQTNYAKEYFNGKFKKATIIENPVFLYHNPKIPCKRKHSIVFVGSNKKEKNRNLAYKSFAIFLESHSDFVLDVYGNNPCQTESEYLHQLGIENSVRFHGKVMNWHQEAFDASAYLLTSDFEGLPNSLLEAVFLGIPSISTDYEPGGANEILSCNRGIVVPCNNAESIANALEKIVSSKYLAQEKTKDINFFNRFNQKNVCDKWLSFIREVLKK